MKSKATVRYANSFFKISLEKGVHENVILDMKALAKIIKKAEGLKSFLSSPVVTAQDIVNILLSKIKADIHPLTYDFFRLLLKRNRAALIPDIPGSYIDHYEARKHIVRAVVKSVQKLSDEQLETLASRLVAKTGATEVRIRNFVDPKLIAGIQIKIGDTIIDANIKNKLLQLKSKIAA